MKQASFIFSQPEKRYGAETMPPIEQRSVKEPDDDAGSPNQLGESYANVE
jgi:hypothetical protein